MVLSFDFRVSVKKLGMYPNCFLTDIHHKSFQLKNAAFISIGKSLDSANRKTCLVQLVVITIKLLNLKELKTVKIVLF